jgi:hypothetical protein
MIHLNRNVRIGDFDDAISLNQMVIPFTLSGEVRVGLSRLNGTVPSEA